MPPTISPPTTAPHPDHIDRPVRMTDATQAMVWDAIWRPFGAVHSITGSASNNLRFPGQYFLIESGLHYNWHRHYDPTIGRYLQADPVSVVSLSKIIDATRIQRTVFWSDENADLPSAMAEFLDGPGIYPYARNSPAGYIDSDGERAKIVNAIRKFFRDIHFEGPNEKFKVSGVGRVCQVRYKDFRIGLDYQEYRRGEGHVLHLNVGRPPATRHLPLDPRKWF
jgi:RHS repeat-associated protein